MSRQQRLWSKVTRSCGSVSYTHLDVYKRQLEIDPPIDDISLRRKGFYERAGYRENPFTHVHPPYREGFAGHPLVVMSYPRQLEREEYDRFYQYLCSVVMKTL